MLGDRRVGLGIMFFDMLNRLLQISGGNPFPGCFGRRPGGPVDIDQRQSVGYLLLRCLDMLFGDAAGKV